MEHGLLEVPTILKEVIHGGEEQIEAANKAHCPSTKRHAQGSARVTWRGTWRFQDSLYRGSSGLKWRWNGGHGGPFIVRHGSTRLQAVVTVDDCEPTNVMSRRVKGHSPTAEYYTSVDAIRPCFQYVCKV